jgi:hypothetical protein
MFSLPELLLFGTGALLLGCFFGNRREIEVSATAEVLPPGVDYVVIGCGLAVLAMLFGRQYLNISALIVIYGLGYMFVYRAKLNPEQRAALRGFRDERRSHLFKKKPGN